MNDMVLTVFSDVNVTNNRKMAKLNEVKIKALRNYWAKQHLMDPVLPKETPAIKEVPSNPVVNAQPPLEVDKTALIAYYKTIINKYDMECYKNTFTDVFLNQVRKLRVNEPVVASVREVGLSLTIERPVEVPKSIVKEEPVINVVQEVVTQPIVEEKAPSVFVEERPHQASEKPSISVDDYLKQNSANIVNQTDADIVLVEQLKNENAKLSEQVRRASTDLAKLEEKYNQIIEAKKARIISDLEREKLDYTTTLNDLSAKINELKANIEKEEI